MSVLVGGAAIAVMQQTLQAREVTEVASLTDALAIIKQQRVRSISVWFRCSGTDAIASNEARTSPLHARIVLLMLSCCAQAALQEQFAKRMQGSQDRGTPP